MSKGENIKHFAAGSLAVWLDIATDRRRRRSLGQRRFVSNIKKARNIILLYPYLPTHNIL